MKKLRSCRLVALTAVLTYGCAGKTNGPDTAGPIDAAAARRQTAVERGAHMTSSVTVRYIVRDVEAAIAFYTQHLSFEVVQHPAPGFATLSRGNLRLLLNKPGAGGAGQSMPDGRAPEPGGWYRIQIEVADLEGKVASLRQEGARFRNDIVVGNGGKQVLLEDPSGNPIELFEPPAQQDRP